MCSTRGSDEVMNTTRSRRPITTRDLLRFRTVCDPQVSPDGTRVAWVLGAIDDQANRYRSTIMLTDTATAQTRALTAGTTFDTHPRWSPDGRRLACLSAPLQGKTPSAATPPQLWVLNVGDGVIRRSTNLRFGAREASWSPDGTRLAFVTRVDPRHGLQHVDDVAHEPDLYHKFNWDVLITTRMRWKLDGAGYFGDTWSHIVVVPFSESSAIPEPRLLTLGRFDMAGPVWSPDGTRIAAIGNVRPDADASRAAYIHVIDPDVSEPGTPPELFGLPEMRKQDLSWSPDSRHLAVCGHDVAQIGHYGNQRLWIVDASDGLGHCVTRDLDRTIGDYSRNQDTRGYGGDDRPRWRPDGSGLFILVNEGGTVHLHDFSLADGTLTRLTAGDRAVTAFSTDRAAQTIVTLIEEDLNPGDLFVIHRGTNGLTRLTDVNNDVLAEVELSQPERFRFASGNVTVDGWIVPPPHREPGQRYPVILYTGGGPGGMRACIFVHEFQVYAAAGYVVIHCNARGNQGYGEAFSTATRGHWGDLDVDDNMACVRAACERFEYLDPERFAVAGGSYGGYMALWIVSHSQAFRAAVVDRALVNRYSMTGTSDIGFLLDGVEFDRRAPWEARQTFLERSPIYYVANVRTPTLVVHSDGDLRCPVEQGEQLYMALKRLGVPTEFVRFSGETHELSRSGRPWQRVFRLERYLDWFNRWL